MSEIRVEVDLPHPPDRVWRALTEPDLLSSWFLPTDLEPGAGRLFQAVPHRVPGFSGAFDIEVMGVVPARSLLMQWRGDQLHAQVTWEIDALPEGSRLTVRQNGFLGVNGTLRRRELRGAYQEMFEERLPVALARLAQAEPVVPRQRSGRLIAAGRAQVVTHDVDNELPSAAPPQPPSFDEPSDPWALSDPLVSAGVALPLPEDDTPPPAPADSHARRTPLRRLASAFPLEERVRAAAITVTVVLVVATVGWLWLTRPMHEDAPPMRLPQATGPAVGDQPGLILPSGVVPSPGVTAGSVPSAAPGASGGPVVGVPGGSATPQPSGSPPPVVASGQALSAAYATQSSTGLLGYSVKVTVTLHNPGGTAHDSWTVVLTVPSGAKLQGSAGSVEAVKDGGTVTIIPKDGGIAPGATAVFDITFGGGALLGIGSGGVTGCTVDGAACTQS